MSDFVSVVFITNIYLQKVGHKIGRKIGHEIGPVLGHVSAARQGNRGRRGERTFHRTLKDCGRGACGKGVVGEEGGPLPPLRWDCGTIEGCGAKAAVSRKTGERG